MISAYDLTENTVRALQQARHEAAALGHPYVGTALGIVAEGK